MARVLQTLSIDLTANTANFSAAMTKAQQISLSSTRNIAKSFALVGAAAAAMATAVAGAVAGLVAKADEYVTQVERMAEKTGQSAEEISKLAYASALTGGNLDDLGGLLAKFNRSAAESAEGNKKAETAFKDLGVSVTDGSGRFRPAGQLLEETIAKLSRMPASIKKTSLEMDVFGRSGAALAPVLKVLGANAAQTEADMKNFGLTISSGTAEAAEHLTETVDRGKMALVGMGNTIIAQAAPALQMLADKVIALANNGQLVAFARTIGEDIAKAATLAGQAFTVLHDHAQAVVTVLKVMVGLEVASWLLSINTNAVRAAGGLDVLVTGVGKAIAKLSGLSGLFTAINAGLLGLRASITTFAAIVEGETFATAATVGLQLAWERLTAAIVANPVTVALAAITAGFGILYTAMESDVRQAERLGGAAVTWQDQWQAAVDNTKDRLAGLKQILQDMLPGSTGSVSTDVKAFNALPSFGQRAEQIAQQRQNATPKPVAPPKPPPLPPAPKPDPQAAKPDPYKEELAKLNQEVANSQLTLNAALQNSVDAQRAATEAGKAGLIVTDLQNKLKRQLTATERAAVTNAVRDTGENEHNAQVVETLRQRTNASRDSLAASVALTAVVGQGAAAEDTARLSIEAATRAREVGAEASARYAAQLSELERFETQAARAARELETSRQTQDLAQEASDTSALAAATLRGAAAVEQETLQLKLNAIVRAHRGDDIATTQKLIDAAVAQTAAEQKLRAVQQGQVYTSPLAQYEKALADINKLTTDAAAAGVQVDATQVWMANREAALRYQQELEKIHAVTGTLDDGVRDFFTDMRNQAMSAATMVHDVLSQAFEGLNDNLARALTGQKTAWASFFKGIADSIAKMGLQKLESSIAGAIFGKGGSNGAKSDPALAQTNAKLDQINATLGKINDSIKASGSGSGASSGSSNDDDASDSAGSAVGGAVSSIASKAGGLFSSLLGGLSGLFGKVPLMGGHMALGGDVQAGMAYDVGEQGRETFVPHSNGSIVPNNKLGGGKPAVHVHVANGVTPEQMKMYTQTMIQQWHPQVVKAAAAHVQDQQRRTTSRTR